ncbi:MAG: type II toxin-antitoxin system VapC family toxin [Opitutales bacterium]
MNFPDTSFLCALYRPQWNSDQADAYCDKLKSPLPVSTLVLFEFRQSTRLQVRLRRSDRRLGFRKAQGAGMMELLKEDLDSGFLAPTPVDWSAVHTLAELLSAKYTEKAGHRFADILHVATALQLSAQTFLTFDANQASLAKAEGLKVPFRMKFGS